MVMDARDLGLAAAILTCPHPTPPARHLVGCCQTPINHLQEATHTLFSLCLRQEAVDLRVPSHHPSLRRTLTPATHISHIAAEKTTYTSDQDGGRNILICLCVCVLCTKRGPPFSLAAVEEGGGGGRGKKPQVMRFVFLFHPASSGISRNKRNMPLKNKVR